MLDSGQFSAWRLNKRIDMDDYCRFLEKNMDWIDLYVNMDEIIPHDVDTAAKLSFEALVEMRRRGFAPINVYHAGEPLEYLDMMLDLGCDYIGISTTSAKGSAIDQFLELAWSKLVTPAGDPVVKVHAFGNSKVETLLKYPWRSADSSSWLRGQKFGKILLPNNVILNHNHQINHSPSTNDIEFIHKDDMHGDYLDHKDFEILKQCLQDLRLDLSLLDARQGRKTWLTHSYIAANYFVQLERRIADAQPIRFKPVQGFAFGGGSKRPGITLDGFDLFMAIGACPSTMPAMHAADGHKPLASFYYTNTDIHAERMRLYHRDPAALMRQEPFAKYMELLGQIVH